MFVSTGYTLCFDKEEKILFDFHSAGKQLAFLFVSLAWV
jgi:hypothetical protein